MTTFHGQGSQLYNSPTKALEPAAARRDPANDPVSRVEWVHRGTLHANNYNPNKVAPPELELLKVSIKEDGWTQPIVAGHDDEIVDGFHRWTVSGHDDMLEIYGGMVPVVRITQAERAARQMATIRHNRARGTHGIMPMANIVREMVDEGLAREEIQRRLGMEDEEVDRLVDRSGMPQRAEKLKQEFGKAWVPGATKPAE